MNRYPHLPTALLRLLEAGPWEGTPTELYATLEPHRVEPWPTSPVSLSLWLKHHAREHSINVEARHTGERRVLRLERESNGLVGEPQSTHTGAFWSFPTWAALLEALPPEQERLEEITLIVDLRSSRIAQTIPTGRLLQLAERWAAQFPHAREVRVYPGAVDTSAVWPLE